jgi:hypothetical protein
MTMPTPKPGAADVVAVRQSARARLDSLRTGSETLAEPLLVDRVELGNAAPVASYAPAFNADHFVSQWIAFHSEHCDAAPEYFEATGLMALSLVTHPMLVYLSGAAEPLRTNLNLAFVGASTSSRKTTTKDYLVKVAKSLPNLCGVLPEMASHEGTVEALSELSGKAALWAIDELGPQLDRLTRATYLAGMLGLVLEMYGKTHYTYKRVSKRRKRSDGGTGERESDDFQVVDTTFSILGCCTPTIFDRLTMESVESGLLPRFAIIWPTTKPPRMARHEVDEARREPSALLARLIDVSTRVSTCTVQFDSGVLGLLDREIDLPIERDADQMLMLRRMGVMAQKVAMLSAAGRVTSSQSPNPQIVITQDDAKSAIIVIRRWMEAGTRFEAHLGRTVFEKNLTKCLEVVRGRPGQVNRREIARRVHLEAKVLREIEATLVQREHIEVTSQKGTKGAPACFWRWVG